MMACHREGNVMKHQDQKRTASSRTETLRRKAVRASKLNPVAS